MTTILTVRFFSFVTSSMTEVPFDAWLNAVNSGEIIHDPSMIELEDEDGVYWSSCKVWRRWNEAAKSHEVVRIGSGAYGDSETVYLAEASNS